MNSLQPLHNLYLSLGSNMSDRFSMLQQAVNKLFEEVGVVVKISPVYETPALGFSGGPFLNCVVRMTTELKPREVLETILEIEKKLGRIRSDSINRSRTIDIDILFFDNQILNSEQLTLPHPEIQNRKFVLQPLQDIDYKEKHPVLQETVSEMLRKCPDTSDVVKQAKWLHNPMQQFHFSKLQYLAVEGNIGVGKTSLATKIAADFNAKLILERFKENPFLPKFYEDPARYAFALEMSFLADRYQQLVEDTTQFDLFKELVVTDYEINKSLIFARITLPEDEYQLYKKLYYVMHKDMPDPDLYVYLYQDFDQLIENIRQRGRSYEQSISISYLQKVHTSYRDFIKTLSPEKAVVIDVSGLDFVRSRKDYLHVLSQVSGAIQ